MAPYWDLIYIFFKLFFTLVCNAECNMQVNAWREEVYIYIGVIVWQMFQIVLVYMVNWTNECYYREGDYRHGSLVIQEW